MINVFTTAAAAPTAPKLYYDNAIITEHFKDFEQLTKDLDDIADELECEAADIEGYDDDAIEANAFYRAARRLDEAQAAIAAARAILEKAKGRTTR